MTWTGNDVLDEALSAFFAAIESTGGVARNAKGLYEPAGDPEWIDLGYAYVRLCASIGRKPMINEGDSEKENDDYANWPDW